MAVAKASADLFGYEVVQKSTVVQTGSSGRWIGVRIDAPEGKAILSVGYDMQNPTADYNLGFDNGLWIVTRNQPLIEAYGDLAGKVIAWAVEAYRVGGPDELVSDSWLYVWATCVNGVI